MSVVRDFDKLKRFNVEQLYDEYQSLQGNPEGVDAKIRGEPKLPVDEVHLEAINHREDVKEDTEIEI